MKSLASYFIVGIVGAAIGIGGVYMLQGNTNVGGSKSDKSVSSDKKEPLYWVAPMDPNYKRDKPGKSPMGMDLIPVYEDGASSDSGPGTVKISPEIINNLGVRTAMAEHKALHDEIKTVGYVKYDEDNLIHIHPRVEGWIEQLYVKAEGDPVKEGQPMYSIYSPALVNAQEEYLLALDRKNKRLTRAAKDRLVALQIPEGTIEEIRKTRKVNQTITVYAPQTGVLAKLNVREGFFVKPGTSMMSIGSLDEVWVEAEVFERQANLVQERAPVTMRLDYIPGRKWQGFVDYIHPTLDAKTRTIKVRLRFSNSDLALKPDMFTQVVIHNHRDETALVIPKEAVIRTGTKDRVVLALGEGRFKSIEVSVGRYDQDSAEILSGINDGDKVVTSAQFLLDSESSKTSDFQRLSKVDDEEKPASVWVEANVKSLMLGHRMVTLTHEPVPEWQWPEMTMDFVVNESIDLESLKPDMTLHVEITRDASDQYSLTSIHVPDNAGAMAVDHSNHAAMSDDHNTATVEGTVNAIDEDERILNISRDAIAKWNRPAATMNFELSKDIVLIDIKPGSRIQFTFMIPQRGQFLITDLALVSGDTEVDHSDHSNH
ncbi:MAG: efflux RND transporter periplasmic adaptor subunit [Pseudomonadales bacterium]|nr:efflux RND transporter periplasmic adaptor subunit [Pseudomonadales bacterium]